MQCFSLLCILLLSYLLLCTNQIYHPFTKSFYNYVLKVPEICTEYYRSRGIKSDLAWGEGETSEMLLEKRDSY